MLAEPGAVENGATKDDAPSAETRAATGLPVAEVQREEPGDAASAGFPGALGIASVRNFILLAAAIWILLVLRRPDAILNPQFWAEDGTIFFREQLLYGFTSAVSVPYAGYFQPLQRLAAALCALLPIGSVPLGYNVCGLTIASLSCATFFLRTYREYIGSDWLRLWLCVLAATAIDSREMLGTLANSPWYLMIVGILLAARPPGGDEASRRVRVTIVALVLAIGVSCPILVIMAPIAAYRVLTARRRFSTLVTLAVTAGALSQTLFATFSRQGVPVPAASLDGLLFTVFSTFTYKVVLQTVLGSPLTLAVAEQQRVGLVLLALAAAAAFFTWVLSTADATNRRRVVATLYLMAASIALPLGGRGLILHALTDFILRGERYFYLASCLLLYLVALGVDRAIGARTDRWKCAIVIAVFAAGLYGNFRIEPFVDLHWRMYAPRIESWINYPPVTHRPPLKVPINPPPWSVELPEQHRDLR